MAENDRSLVTPAELGAVVGLDLDTVNNWLRHGIIKRAAPGGRKLRARLFSIDDVFRVALIFELRNHLAIQPSLASHIANDLWDQWDTVWEKIKNLKHGEIYAVGYLDNDGDLKVQGCLRELDGGPFFRIKNITTKREELKFPDHSFIVIPVSKIFQRIKLKMTDLIETQNTAD